MRHEALLPLPAPKMNDMFFRGACSCGWVSHTWGTPRDARRASKSHVKAKQNEVKRWEAAELQALVEEAEVRGHLPEHVLNAARLIWKDQFDVAAIGWERGTTVVVVFKWDSTAAVRYTLNADLTDVLKSEHVERRGRQS